MENVSRSIALINAVYGKNYTLNVRDLDRDTGMGPEVEIRVPI